VSLNVLEDFTGAADSGITPDDSPARDEYLQGSGNQVQSEPNQQLLRNNKASGNVIEQIELLLRSKYQFRYNVVSNRIGFKLLSQPEAPYADMRDYDTNSILLEIKHEDIPCSKETLRNLLRSNFTPEYDPYIDYVNSLPEWDGVTDYIGQLADTVTTTQQEFFRLCFTKWIVVQSEKPIEPQNKTNRTKKQNFAV